MSRLVFLIALGSVSLNTLAQIAVRQTMLPVSQLPTAGKGLLQLVSVVVCNPWFLFGISCYVFSLGLWLFVLSELEVSAAYPYFR
jgi:hypothetical protein